MRSSVAFLALAACCASLCVVSAAAASVQYTPAALADKVTSLPGVDQMPGFNMFSGYLTVDASVDRSIFYCQSNANQSARVHAQRQN